MTCLRLPLPLPWRLASAAALIAWLSACGGGDAGPPAAPLPPLASAVLDPSRCDAQSMLQGEVRSVDGGCQRATPALRASKRPLGVSATAAPPGFTVDMLMDWAERAYPQYFAPQSQPTQSSSPYTYRHYPGTGTYLGVAGDDVYVMGPLSGGVIAHVGTMADFSCEAAHIDCKVPGAPVISRVKPFDGSAIVQFSAPASAGTTPIAHYTATCARGFAAISSASGPGSPITVPNLVNGASHSCVVTATNQQGTSAPSAAMSVTPSLPLSYQKTRVMLTSDFGDYIGGGRHWEYTRADALLSVTEGGGHLVVNVSGDSNWTGNFVLPAGKTTWAPGTYPGLTRWPFHGASGGLDWSGDGRGCNSLTGSITVDAVTYNDEGSLDAIMLSFVQHCEGGSAALRGRITWGADDPTAPPGPVSPIPATLWQPAAGAVLSSGNFVYLQSDNGDYIGSGRTATYTDFTVSGGGALLGIGVGDAVTSGAEWWTGNFAAMAGTSPLQVGYYPGLGRYPFHNPVKGGLDWSGSGRGCNRLTGWFAIDDIAYQGGSLQRVALRFEQHCEGLGPALHGQVKWGQ